MNFKTTSYCRLCLSRDIKKIFSPKPIPLGEKYYFNKIIPILGSLLSRKDAFLYLPESVAYFLNRDEVCSKMENVGFKDVSYTDYTFGVVTIYTGIKP